MSDPGLDEAYAARLAGRGDDALAAGRRLLAADLRNAAARGLVGLCLLEAGDVAGAGPLIEEAVDDAPEDWRLLLNLSALREVQGDMDAALAAAEQAHVADPSRFEPWGRLGDLLARRGEFAGAVAALERALAIQPDHPGMALLLAGAAYSAGQFDVSARALAVIARAAPSHPQVLQLRTHLARRGGDGAAFAAAAEQWLSADPASVPARVALAHACAQQEDYHRAVDLTRPLVAADADNADHAATLGRYLLWARDFAGAEHQYQRALSLQPGHADAAAGLARLNIYKGRNDAAAALAQTAISTDPAHLDGYSQLALASDGQLSDAQLDRLGRLAADPAVEAENRAVAWFTLGDVYHRRRDPERAFAAWQAANALKQGAAAKIAGASYDPAATERLVDRLATLFSAVPALSSSRGAPGPTPVFIVGMPRSGTTLLDSALAGHADISSGGELPMMPAALKRFLGWAEQAGWRGGAIPAPVADQLRERYLQQYATYGIAEARFTTDKQPINFWSVGLIRQLFPAAPIIHIRRDAMETGFSIFRKNFSRSWPFATSLDTICHQYGQYVRMMAHWEVALGDALASVHYETLVGDFEGELRRILAQFGIAWDPGCLTYHQRDSVVTTLSATQVRKGPSQAHLHATTPYAAMLEPLKKALRRAGVV